ncbi:MAG: tRNA lysidine(34) synthetase TilS [Syntrophomonadaceae bacterium]|jgi:tRNA(Ile)-lysidine synthase|nr:tRNA lysidine(34) synthetase TilS [Syntrophomonadaceae bacterium]
MVRLKVKDYINKYGLFRPGATVIAAVSGGPDSIALLHILKTLAAEFRLQLLAAHVNHQLRPEADEEEAFVQRLCSDWEIALYCHRVEVEKRALANRKGIEETARESRYEFFQQLKEQLGADYVATAHHRHDQAETILMHIMRGSGIKGLRGILPVSDYLIRPLLGLDRREIEAYLEAEHLSFCTDLSNYDTRFLRNRVRQELIPILEQDFNPRIVERLDMLGCIAREEYEAMTIETEKLLPSLLLSREDKQVILDQPQFVSLHPAFQRRLLLIVLSWLKGEEGWSALDLCLIVDLAGKPGSAKRIKLGQGIWVQKIYDRLIIGEKPPKELSFSYPLSIPGSIRIAETGETFSFALIKRSRAYSCKASEMHLDYDALPKADLCWRSRRQGDRMTWTGMGSKKIKKYFIDKKIPYGQRNSIPLLASEQEVYAVWGHGISTQAAVKDNTVNILVIRRELDDHTK